MEYEDIVIPKFGVYVPPAVIDAAMELGDEGPRFLFAVVTEMYSDGPVSFGSYSSEPWYPTFIVAVDAVDLSTGDEVGH